MKIYFENEYTSLFFDTGKDGLFLKELKCCGKRYVYSTKNATHNIVQIIGKPYFGTNFNRHVRPGETFTYLSHKEERKEGYKELTIEEKGENAIIKTVYVLYDGCAVVECHKEITNISGVKYDINCVAPMSLTGILEDSSTQELAEERSAYREEISISDGAKCTSIENIKQFPYLWVAHNSWCAEVSFERLDLRTCGLRRAGLIKKCGKICIASNGTQTTHRYLPMGILEKEQQGLFLFELVPEGSWSYELEAGARDFDDAELFLTITGKNYTDNAWYKTLMPNENYITDTVRLLGGEDFDAIGKQMTIFRRKTRKMHKIKACDQVIYNNFQQNTFGMANEKDDALYIPLAAEMGADYYVTDAGWHDDTSALNGCKSPTHAIGRWKESASAYPSGLIKTIERVHEYGMKFGLWVELQSIGFFCETKDFLSENCYFHLNGVRTLCNNRYQLDYSKPEVRLYADNIIKELVDKYSPEYIKIDYNQSQPGNDCVTGSNTEGVALHCRAYDEWFNSIQNKYPDIIFETCASGGMRNDAKSVELSSVISVTDQGAYYNYPYIMANMPLAVLPEQSGVWNMPIRKTEYPKTSDEEVIMNSINSFYGVMHLCSKLEALNETQKELVKEGISYYRKLAVVKESAFPVFPNGITMFDDDIIFIALMGENKLYLSVYNMSDKMKIVEKDLHKYAVKTVELVYPSCAMNDYSLRDNIFCCELDSMTARSFEFDIE